MTSTRSTGQIELIASDALLASLPGTRGLAAWYAALSQAIATHLTPAHALILARPVAEGGRVTWLAAGLHARPYSSFNSQDRDRLIAVAGAMLADIRRLAESGAAPVLSEAWPALRDVPDFDHVFAVDGRPVLAGWGHAGSPVLRAKLLQADDGLPYRRPARWDWPVTVRALLAAAVICLVAGLVLPFASAWLPAGGICLPDKASVDLTAAQRRSDAKYDDLVAQRAALIEQQGQRVLACPLPTRPGQPPSPPPHVDLPQQQWDHHDLTMLEGCWALDDHSMATRLGADGAVTKRLDVVHHRLCFDHDGHGTQTIEYDDGSHCTDPLAASFGSDGAVTVNESSRCKGPGNQKLTAQIRCERASDQTALCTFHATERHPGANYVAPGDASHLFRRDPSQ